MHFVFRQSVQSPHCHHLMGPPRQAAPGSFVVSNHQRLRLNTTCECFLHMLLISACLLTSRELLVTHDHRLIGSSPPISLSLSFFLFILTALCFLAILYNLLVYKDFIVGSHVCVKCLAALCWCFIFFLFTCDLWSTERPCRDFSLCMGVIFGICAVFTEKHKSRAIQGKAHLSNRQSMSAISPSALC